MVQVAHAVAVVTASAVKLTFGSFLCFLFHHVHDGDPGEGTSSTAKRRRQRKGTPAGNQTN
jgi:hypothetical protein